MAGAVYYKYQARFLLHDGVMHGIDDVDYTVPNVVLSGVCLLLFSYGLEDCWLDPVSDAGTC